MNITEASKKKLLSAYQTVRGQTEKICLPLEIEDYVIQSIDDVSPPKWHLAHTTWFFETFLLIPFLPKYKMFNLDFKHLFNSYYQSLGYPYPRVQRGLLSRPTVETIYAYRKHVDKYVIELINQLTEATLAKFESIFIIGLNHEQQHQELLLMDIKYNFSLSFDSTVYHAATSKEQSISKSTTWVGCDGGTINIGYEGNQFCFDNELPRHSQILNPYYIAAKLTSNSEYLEFIMAGGYQDPQWWLSDGWDSVQKYQWHAPLYWQQINKDWYIFTLNGLCKLNLAEPVAHISYYEADAYARWRGQRLPTEAEWEYFVTYNHLNAKDGNFLEKNFFHPQATIKESGELAQFFGDLWEWTASSYSAYPGYKPLEGALGEYNGKFMSNQMVLRGGCCVTPQSHIRASYRNFFQPEKRWQFSGIRLACNYEEIKNG